MYSFLIFPNPPPISDTFQWTVNTCSPTRDYVINLLILSRMSRAENTMRFSFVPQRISISGLIHLRFNWGLHTRGGLTPLLTHWKFVLLIMIWYWNFTDSKISLFQLAKKLFLRPCCLFPSPNMALPNSDYIHLLKSGLNLSEMVTTGKNWSAFLSVHQSALPLVLVRNASK